MAKDTKKNKVKKEKKENQTFLKDFKAELKKVTWPTAKQLANKTAIVIAIVLIISAIVFVLDFAFDKGYEFVVTKASSALNKTETTNTTEDENTNETTSDGEESVTTENVDGASDITLDANTTDEGTAE